ncbi:MAG TPA: STAS/SEC14 domain-containing protein [Burkholderiales bacterium]|nr:STAS/SEC14 domain-containing protein [Burkholderiales bacterium]
MISVQHEGRLTVAAVFGKFELADYRRFEEEVSRQIAHQGQLNLLIDLRDMLGFTVDVALEDIRFAREHARDVGRIAILSERDAVAWSTLLAQLFVDTEMRVFDDEALARTWLAGEPS